MKKVIGALVIVVLLSLGFVNKTAIANTTEGIFYKSPCENPRTYSIGEVDPRFKISKDEFLAATKQAGVLWKNNKGETLFVYDPSSKLTISLIYDERQFLNSQITDLNDKVEEEKDSLKPEIAQYEQRAAAFKKRNQDLNTKISYWNDQGGAPEQEYDKLQQEQRALQQEALQLQQMASSLNQSTDDYNSQIQNLDQKVDAYNDTLAVKPEEGLYVRDKDGERITIYFNNTRPELIHTLAHEMGHAIGVSHVNDPRAIMYPKTTENIQLSNADIAALQEACRKRSALETGREKLSILLDDIRALGRDLMQKVSPKE